MADQNSDQEKTEEPTARKLEKAREDGNVSLSKEISSVALLIAAIMTVVGSSGRIYARLEEIFESFFQKAGGGFEDKEEVIGHLREALWGGLEVLMPLMIALMVTVLLVNLSQTKMLFSIKAIAFKGSKMNPINGLKKIFSVKGSVELAKGLLKLAIVLWIGYKAVYKDITHFVTFVISPLEYSLTQMGSFILLFLIKIIGALLFLSVADAAFQRFQWKKELKMTKQEVKDEFKQMEGDPHVKGQRKQFGMKLRRQRRLDHSVLASDVVVTNPIHFAVALRYDPDNGNAPIVMAKGQRLRAERIKELANHYGIPIVVNIPVARALFATTEVDEYIPEEQYKAVAEILAYVYKLKQDLKV